MMGHGMVESTPLYKFGHFLQLHCLRNRERIVERTEGVSRQPEIVCSHTSRDSIGKTGSEKEQMVVVGNGTHCRGNIDGGLEPAYYSKCITRAGLIRETISEGNSMIKKEIANTATLSSTSQSHGNTMGTAST